MIKVCYFTSKSDRDVRVFKKECISLVKNGYEVYLVSPGEKKELTNGVNIIGVPYNKKGIFNRLFILPKLLYKEALKINADIYHFNDPASLPYGSKLKRKGKKVIFDSFEDHPTLLFEKKTLPYIFRHLLSKAYSYYEYINCKNYDAIICCYHWTKDRLITACNNIDLIFNYPIIKEEDTVKKEYNTTPAVCYAGLLSDIWNIENILLALTQFETIQFNLAGHGNDPFIKKLKASQSWNKVNFLGQIKHEEVHYKIFNKSLIAMALLDYIPLCKGNIGNLSNNKLFEYMMAGLPVICTDFILWKEVIEQNYCGICVNPRNIKEIVDAISFLLKNPEVAANMGKNGRKMIETKYNWELEERKLIKIYKSLSVAITV